MSKFHTLKIKEIKQETEKAVSIAFTVPTDLASTFSFIPGQYITLKTEIKGEEVRRAYSICSSSSSTELRVAVKAVEKGLFSNHAVSILKEGDSLDVAPPEGKFVLETNAANTKNYIAFAAGSGITPIMSMIKSVLTQEMSSKFVLVYGNKSEEDAIFKAELDALVATYPKQLEIQYVFSKKLHDGALFGRIDKSVTNLLVKNKHKNISFDGYFLCGPEAMINTVTETLKENNVEAGKIHFELFSVAEATGSDATKNLDGNSLVTVVLDDEETTIEVSKKEILLNAMLDKDLDAPYSCQGGICSSCIGKVTEGKAVMDNNAILTDSEIADGYILTCQAHATTDKLKIDFDDV
ncbi:ferredoxin--NADP reductase [Aureivirga marina]|uniref:ferredoxin--NADP reductase n=1 Tax=Aureivirga marina TaxID=1182451 RepID=UPI0018C9A6D1|nr:ferredoxin--NADP reductase [Aureivirga marina]